MDTHTSWYVDTRVCSYCEISSRSVGQCFYDRRGNGARSTGSALRPAMEFENAGLAFEDRIVDIPPLKASLRQESLYGPPCFGRPNTNSTFLAVLRPAFSSSSAGWRRSWRTTYLPHLARIKKKCSSGCVMDVSCRRKSVLHRVLLHKIRRPRALITGGVQGLNG